MSDRKPGILLINLGTPDAPKRKDVNRYLLQFLTDGRVIDIPWLQRQLLVRGIIVPLRAGNSTRLYQELWSKDGSPLKFYGERLCQGVAAELDGRVPVSLGMRYQNPSIESALDQLLDQGVNEVIVFPLFPHYASASTGSAFEEVMRVVMSKQIIPSLYFVQDYFEHDAFLDVFVAHCQSFDLDAYDHMLFSYHGLPQRQLVKADNHSHCLKNKQCCQVLGSNNRDCYSAQSHATTRKLAAKLGLKVGRYSTCFQSRLGKEPWTQPYTSQVLKERAQAGDRRILVISPSFVADCLETIVEVGVEYQEEFVGLGGEKLDLVPSLNDDPAWVRAILSIIKDRVNLP
jgi:ferrochelatase